MEVVDRCQAGPWDKRAITWRNHVASMQTHPSSYLSRVCVPMNNPFTIHQAARSGCGVSFVTARCQTDAFFASLEVPLCKVRCHFALCKSNQWTTTVKSQWWREGRKYRTDPCEAGTTATWSMIPATGHGAATLTDRRNRSKAPTEPSSTHPSPSRLRDYVRIAQPPLHRLHRELSSGPGPASAADSCSDRPRHVARLPLILCTRAAHHIQPKVTEATCIQQGNKNSSKVGNPRRTPVVTIPVG
jgi:hypothetical protein